MNRSGEVYYQDQLAGIISEEEDGYVFMYKALLINNLEKLN
ncbi:hypothetical protein FHS57_006377 [Runella defluvii]|uniref:Uncharacterized protein n=1 Tax=Runella defluvii TaxID=370973 RepID=A0A7W5ZT07_9BACT|nr:hypothetical protein [Runella defluvii]MBB3842346.1 hypothetical protein [Runella defluvii]